MKILITGATGQIGSHLIPLLSNNAHALITPTRQEMDITDAGETRSFIANHNPELVINLAAYTAVDLAESNVDLAFATNHFGASNVSKASAAVGAAIIHLSTDYVFSGEKGSAYTEDDLPNPVNIYGKSKLAGELAVKQANSRHLILRTAWVFSGRPNNFVTKIVELAQTQSSISIVDDQFGNPTYANDVALTLATLVDQTDKMTKDDWGIYHYAGMPSTTWFNLAAKFFHAASKNTQTLRLIAISSNQYNAPARRPNNSCLATRKISEKFGISPCNWCTRLNEIGNSDNNYL